MHDIEMKLLRPLRNGSTFRLLDSSRKSFVSLPQVSRQNIFNGRHFRSTRPRSRGQEDRAAITLTQNHVRRPLNESKVRPAWSVFDSIIGEIDTQRTKQEQHHKTGDSIRMEQFRETRDYGNEHEESSRECDDSARSNVEESSPEKLTSLNNRKGIPVANFGGQTNGEANSSRNVSGSKKKVKIKYVCDSCGYTEGQWWGICRNCKNAGTMKQVSDRLGSNGNLSGNEVSENVLRSWLPQQTGERPLRITDVNRGMNQLQWRIQLTGEFGSEVNRVIGGGIVPGSLMLVGGDPGVGKSTMLLQLAAAIAGQSSSEQGSVVYVSGEESVEQIGNRADRLNIESDNLYLYSSTEIEDILEKIQPLSPRTLIIDSIQTVYLSGTVGSAGGMNQVKECTSALLRFAKKTNVSVILIGHVTKSGEIAGPRVLEHIVDVVLYMEGDKSSAHRLLRPVKNRFGSIDELGVFEMAPSGLKSVTNPCELFLRTQISDSEVLAGLAVAVIMDGSRCFLIEIQALCASGSTVLRHVNGIPSSKADMIISILAKQAGLMLQQNSVFLNVVGGVTLTETSGDLAIAAAICSSFLECPIPTSVAFIGEVGLGGELRPVNRMDRRVATLAKMGYKKCIVPKLGLSSILNVALEEMQLIGCSNLKEMINSVFK